MANFKWCRFLVIGAGLLGGALDPPPAHAQVTELAGVATSIATVKGLKKVVYGLGSQVGAGLREQMNKFVTEQIDPLIERVSGIVSEKITQVADESIRVLDHAADALHTLIDHAQISGEKLTDHVFEQLNATLSANPSARLS